MNLSQVLADLQNLVVQVQALIAATPVPVITQADVDAAVAAGIAAAKAKIAADLTPVEADVAPAAPVAPSA